MKREDVKRFLHKEVKLVQKDNWAIYGRILEVKEDSIIFRSRGRDSIISFDFIAMILDRSSDAQ
ncbi:MAG: hypothetical protein KAW45_02860 [Thermoplasmatales archaeon]|nr:hypothetical protein [Thermoplasmatales archaeon]